MKRPVAAAAVLLALAACSDKNEGAVALTASDTACRVATTDVRAGKVRFAIKNAGRETTEVYVYADGDSSFAVTVDLVDEDGTFLDRANALSVTVANVAPTVASCRLTATVRRFVKVRLFSTSRKALSTVERYRSSVSR